MSFGPQLVGTTSAAQAVTITNTGNETLTISGITANGDFAQTNNCGTSVPAGGSCSVQITFTPTATDARLGTLAISSDSLVTPPNVSLSGTGAVASPTLSPTSLSYSNQNVGTKSGGKTVKLTANAPGPLVIASIAVTGDFLQTNNCPASLNPGQSCNISVSFLPTMAGPEVGALLFNDNGQGSPQTVPLSDNGLDYMLSTAPSSVSVDAGSKAMYIVTVTQLGGTFNNSVNLSCSGLPAASKCSFSPRGLTPKTGSANSTLTIQTTAQSGTSGTPSGTYSIAVIGTSGALSHSTSVILIVN